MRVWTVLAPVCLLLAGCAGPEALPEAGTPVAGPFIVLGPAEFAGQGPALWNGTLAVGATARIPFTISGTVHAQRLEVSIAWDLFSGRDFDLVVEDAGGRVVARGLEPDAAIGVQGLSLVPVPGSAAVALMEAAPPGAYVAVVAATTEGGRYQGVVQFEPAVPREPVRDLLPNVVTLRPRDLQIRDPDGLDPAMQAAGVKGCRADEVAEFYVTRCLRFSNGIANVGEGPLEMRLAPEEGALGLAGQGEFVQRIWRSDGTWRDAPVGHAVFHPFHGHFHYAGAAKFELFAYDWDAQERGSAVRASHKTGFCFADLSLAELGLPNTHPPTFDGSGCFDPTVDEAWVTGLAPNWFDRYHWTWFEQYVDVTGVPDGVYELVSTANYEGTMMETTPDDNTASVVFRLTGDDVTVLEA